MAPLKLPRKAKRAKTERQKRAENRSFVHRRLADLQRIVLGLRGGKVPTGHRNVIMHLAAVHIVSITGDPIENVAAWCRRWIGDMDDKEIQATVKTALKKRYRYKGSTIGKKLGLTPDQVARLSLTTINFGTDEERKEHKLKRDREAKRRERLESGAKPQAESAERPAHFIPGNRMTFPGIKDAQPGEGQPQHRHSARHLAVRWVA